MFVVFILQVVVAWIEERIVGLKGTGISARCYKTETEPGVHTTLKTNMNKIVGIFQKRLIISYFLIAFHTSVER